MSVPKEYYPEAFKMAGQHLQACMEKSGCSDFRWIKTQPTSPSFADLVFAREQRMYAVLLAAMTSQKKAEDGSVASFEIPSDQRDILLQECERYRLEPVVFPIWLGIMQPLVTSWNLFSLKDMQPVFPDADELLDDDPVEMSEWELCNFRVQIILHELAKEGRTLLSFQDIPGIYPNIWFVDEQGRRSWLAVFAQDCDDVSMTEILEDLKRRIPAKFGRYRACVGVLSAEHPELPPQRAEALAISCKGIFEVS